MKNKIMQLLILCLSAVLLGGCASKDDYKKDIAVEKEEENETVYITAQAEIGDVIKVAKLDCSYTPTVQKDYAFPVGDKEIAEVNVKERSIVKKGDLLVALDVKELGVQLETEKHEIASLELSLAQKREMKEFELQSARTLFEYTKKTDKDKKNLAKKEKSIEESYEDVLQDLEDEITFAKKRYEEDLKEYDEGRIVSDLDGVVTYRKTALENTLCVKDEKVLTISDLESCYFIVGDVTMKDFFLEGEIYYVEYTAKDGSAVCEVTPVNREEWESEMWFALCNEEVLNQGQAGTISINLEEKKGVLTVPTKALHESEGQYFVYVLENGMRRMQFVEVGLVGLEMTEIKEGLKEGETVILK